MSKLKKSLPYQVTHSLFKDYVNMILFYTWDPIRLSNIRAPLPKESSENDCDIQVIRTDYDPFSYGVSEDEYTSYCESVQYLIIEGKSEVEIYQYLRMVETELMETGNAEVTKFAAKRLHAIGKEIGYNG